MDLEHCLHWRHLEPTHRHCSVALIDLVAALMGEALHVDGLGEEVVEGEPGG
jgi:hypothetical protein